MVGYHELHVMMWTCIMLVVYLRGERGREKGERERERASRERENTCHMLAHTIYTYTHVHIYALKILFFFCR